MDTPQRLETFKSIRTIAVLLIGTAGVFLSSYVCLSKLVRVVAGGKFLGGAIIYVFGMFGILSAVTALLCIFVFALFSIFGKVTLEKAIRLNEAMRMLYAETHYDSLQAIRYYRITIFKSKTEIGNSVQTNVHCTLVSSFLSPLFFRVDRLSALGSSYYCCDYAEIQHIITTEQQKWGSGETSQALEKEAAYLRASIDELQQKNKEVTQKYTAAAGREGALKKRLEEVEAHMAVLVTLAHKATKEITPPRTLSRDEIKKYYKAIGNAYGLAAAPTEYVELFRKTMPRDYINWSGAPIQGVPKG